MLLLMLNALIVRHRWISIPALSSLCRCLRIEVAVVSDNIALNFLDAQSRQFFRQLLKRRLLEQLSVGIGKIGITSPHQDQVP